MTDALEHSSWVEPESIRMSQTVRVQVLMPPEEAGRFEAFCQERGHKKSTLIARLVREYLDREDYGPDGVRPARLRGASS